jgi:hypothetical protein
MKDLLSKIKSRKAAAGLALPAAALVTGTDITWPVALVLAAYVLAQGYVDAQKGTE